MKLKTLIIIQLFISTTLIAQINKVNVTIKVFSESLNQSDKIYISGNNEQFGNWHPDSITLDKTENHWKKAFKYSKNELLEFKFTKGSWNTQALNEDGDIPGNHSLKVINDTTLIYSVNSWGMRTQVAAPQGQITGKVIYHEQMTFEGLLPRDIIVWLPPGYEENKDQNYPVLYMQDGQSLFDPITSYTKIDWQIDEAADSLIRKNEIEPIIIVGIYNTADRNEEYAPTPKGTKYMQFIITKLKPFIDKSYRTLPDRINTAVGGSSMGGLISFILAWNYSSYISKAACLSPAFKYDNFDHTKIVEYYFGVKKDLRIYIDNGGVGIEKNLQPGIDSMIEQLNKKDFITNKDLFITIDSTAQHNEAAWAKRVFNPLKIFFNRGLIIKNNITDSLKKIEYKKYSKNILSRRTRLQVSSTNKFSRDSFEISLPIIFNLNFRNSQLDSIQLKSNVSLSFSTESGVNVYPDAFFILPYFKIGPELRLYKNLYIDAHVGIGLTFSIGGFLPFPFWGTEAGYIFNLSKNHSLEFEIGTNGVSEFYTYYSSIAVSF
jgi:predicted alpha/beta superfamily hydrolase